MTKEYRFHPAANAYPMLDGAEKTALVDSIRERGLLNDIVRLDGQILDGRNRLVCCEEAGVAPRFREYSGDTSPQGIADFVRDQNANRRHLDSGQRAMAIVRLSKFVEAAKLAAKERQRSAGGDKRSAKAKESVTENDSVSETADKNERTAAADLAKQGGTNPHYVYDAKKVDDADPELGDQVRDGKVKLHAAKAQIAKREGAAERKQKNKQFAQPTVDAIKNLKDSPGILVSSGWWRPNDSDWMQDVLHWKLQQRLDQGGGIIVFRTNGETAAASRAMSLLKAWELTPWPHQITVTIGDSAEWIVIGTAGKPDTSKLPSKPRTIATDDVESLVLSWLKPWAKERGTPNLIAELCGSKAHDGFQFFPWKPEPVQC